MFVSRLRRESCQQYRQAAGSVVEALIGADWTRHHATTDSAAVSSRANRKESCGQRRRTNINPAVLLSKKKRAVIGWAPAYRSLKKLGRLFKHLLTRYQARRIAADNRQAAGATTPNGTPVSLMSAFGGHGTD